MPDRALRVRRAVSCLATRKSEVLRPSGRCAPVVQLRADGLEVRDEDVARLSPFVRHHINVLGRYSFQLPDLPGGLRPLRAPDAMQEG
ncbi:Tn3 family transposase [Microbispora rosea]|uniref:Tn3 family transposase n=1 Tax=Microbispora rosea TaxID=58117 RepID=UPI003D911431